MSPAFLRTLVIALVMVACTTTEREHPQSTFSKADTLTDQFLVLQDSLHHRWLHVSMHEQLHNEQLRSLFEHLQVLVPLPAADRTSIEIQIEQLHHLQLNPRNITNPDVIHEHDLARHALTTDLFRLIQAHRIHERDSTIAHTARRIQEFQQNTWPVRMHYDSLARQYNQFLLQHRETLRQGDPENKYQPRPLFQAVFK